MRLLTFIALVACLATPVFAAAPARSPLARDNLFAWCIVPYDNQNRSPAQRMALLKELGLRDYVWDWRAEHLSTLPAELRAAKEAGISLRAIWLWIDERTDTVDKLGEANETVIKAVEAAGLPMEYWVGFHENYFEPYPEADRVARGAKMVAALRDRAKRTGGSVALYNHGGWFGDPRNEVKIIETAGRDHLGLVYNFHHAHEQLAIYPELVPLMLPFLRAVNLNGMRAEGPKIIPLGEGNLELGMIQQLLKAGYTGPFGVLGHVEHVDVKPILEKNLQGAQALAEKLESMQ